MKKEKIIKLNKKERGQLGRLMKTKGYNFERVYLYVKYVEDLVKKHNSSIHELNELYEALDLILRKGLIQEEVAILRSDMTYKEYCEVIESLGIFGWKAGNKLENVKKNFHEFALLKEFFRKFDKAVRERNKTRELEEYEKVYKVFF